MHSHDAAAYVCYLTSFYATKSGSASSEALSVLFKRRIQDATEATAWGLAMGAHHAMHAIPMSRAEFAQELNEALK